VTRFHGIKKQEHRCPNPGHPTAADLRFDEITESKFQFFTRGGANGEEGDIVTPFVDLVESTCTFETFFLMQYHILIEASLVAKLIYLQVKINICISHRIKANV